MKRMQTFRRGGIHPPESKRATSTQSIRHAPLPATALVPFSQHIGTPARPLVEIGDHVHEAQLIGEPVGFVSAAVHAPIPGTVKEIRPVYLPSGVKSDAVVIEMDGEFSRSGKPPRRRKWEEMDAEEILSILKSHGVVGQGGATFPTHVKCTVPRGRRCEVLLINAAECEPYITADHRLMLEMTKDVVDGIRIMNKLLQPGRSVVGIESNKTDAMEKLAGFDFEVMPLKVKYPQGAEKNLIEAVIGREVPPGKLPIEVGVINLNVGTLVSISQAIQDDMPLIERVVTVAGGAVREPANIRVRVGSAIGDLFEECGGFREEPAKFISGGPMMGFSFTNLDTPITKGSSGVLALTQREVHAAKERACVSCGRCVAACPMGLSPTAIYKNIEHERLDEAVAAGLDDCVLCGACAYVCPSHIPLVSAIRAGRGRQRRLLARERGRR